MKTVLIIDDDDAVRESLMAFFEDRGWRALPAVSGEAALEILARERPDGAVVDIRLPGMDGNAFVRQAIRNQSSLAYIIVTGSPEYQLPEDIMIMSRVSGNVFAKPVIELDRIEKALLHQINQGTA